MFGQPFADFPGQIQAWKTWVFLLEQLDDAQALLIVFEAARAPHQAVERRLTRVPKRRMAKIVSQSDRFRQILVQPQSARDVSADRGHFHGVGQACPQVVAGSVEKDLRLILESAKGARVNDAVTVPLILGAKFRRRLPMDPPATVALN
jgi:hypothetical protein